MRDCLEALRKHYISSYTGLNAACWPRIWLFFIIEIPCSISFFLPIYFVHDLSISVADAGLIVSCYGIGTVMAGFLSGRLSDRYPPTWTSIGSLCLMALSYFVLLDLHTVTSLAINAFFLGLGFYSFITSNNTYILATCQHSETQRLKAISLIQVLSNLGLSLTAALVGILSVEGFHIIFYLASASLLLGALFLISQPKTPTHTSEPVSAPEDTPITEPSHHKSNLPLVWAVLTCVFLIGIIVAQWRAVYSLYAIAAFPDWGTKAVSVLFIVNAFMIVLAQAPLVNSVNHFNKILMVGIGAALMGFGMMMLNFFPSFSFAIFACVVYTVGEMIFFAMAQLVIYQAGARDKKGASLGLYRSVYASSIIVGPTLGAAIYHHYNPQTLWYLCGIIGALCLLVCAKFVKKQPPKLS